MPVFKWNEVFISIERNNKFLNIIGDNCTVKGGAVIGKTNRGAPVIQNNVCIGVHAIIIGPIIVADGTKIGAGAIVTHSTPENSTVICDSAHILEK